MRRLNSTVNNRIRNVSAALMAAVAMLSWSSQAARAGVDKKPNECVDFFWDTMPGDPGITGAAPSSTNVFALAIVGNDLFAGGQFTGAGGNPMTNIARWNGSTWETVGNAVGIVRAMASYEGELYAAGEITSIDGVTVNRIARFDGSQWHALPSGPTAQGNRTIRALAVHDGELFIGGQFSGFIGVPNSMRIVRWNGTSFSNVGGYNITGQINALASFDGGLYMAGAITNIRPPGPGMPNIPVNNIARWDGAAWSPMGSPAGVNGAVNALAAYGSHLYVGGTFTTAGGMPAAKIAAWDGSAWSSPGAIASGNVHAMVSHDDGETINLFVGGSFNSVSGVPVQNIAQFDGANWTALLGGVGINTSIVYALASHSECVLRGTFQPSLYAGGNFLIADAGPTAQRVARWVACEDDGGTDPNDPCDEGWDVASGNPGPNDIVWALKAFGFSDGCTSENNLYAGGEFDGLDDPIEQPLRGPSVDSPGLMQWDGEEWSDVDGGVYRRTGPNEYPDGFVYSLHEFDANDGGGNQLYVGGHFSTLGTFLPEPPDTEASLIGNNLLRTDGFTWTDIGGVSLGTSPNTSGYIRAMASDDEPRLNDEPTLYIGGAFDTANVPSGIPPHVGTIEADNVAQWDAVNGWSALGGGVNGIVYAMVFTDIGEGDSLYVGGDFDEVYNVVVNADGTRGLETVVVDHIARWDGSAWHAVGAGFDHWVITLTVFDDGEGAKLYAGGTFGEAGNAGVRGLDNIFGGVARWDGQEWERVGDFLYSDSLDPPFAVYNLTVYDDGHGERLYAGGGFIFTGIPPVFDFVGNLAVLNTNINQWEASEHGAVFGEGGVLAMTPYFDGKGGNTDPLYVGGVFGYVSLDPDEIFLSQPEGIDFQLTQNVAAIRTCGARPCEPLVDEQYANPGADGAVFAALPLSPTDFDFPHFVDSSATLIAGSFQSVENATRVGSSVRNFTGNWIRFVDLYSEVLVGANDGESDLVPGVGYAAAESPTDEEFVQITYIGGDFDRVDYLFGSEERTVITDNVVGVAFSDGIIAFELAGGVDDFVYALEAASNEFFPSDARGVDVYPLLDAVVFAGGDFVFANNLSGDTLNDGGEGPSTIPVLVNHVAMWDSDSNSWSALGNGLNARVDTLLLDTGGTSPLLYAGGEFDGPGGADVRGGSLNHVAVFDFDTEQWNDIGGGLDSDVDDLELFQDEGASTYLFAIGDFNSGSGVDTLDGFAYFDGKDWLPATPPDDYAGSGSATVLHAYDDGQGPALFLAYGVNDPEARGGFDYSRIARYRNGEWTHITDPIFGDVFSMHGYFNEIDNYHYLVVGGGFSEINDVDVLNVTRIRLCPAASNDPEAVCASPRIVDLIGTTGEIAYGSPTVMAVATSGLNVTYQWSRNGEPLVDDERISGAATSMLTISGALSGPDGDTGVYTVAAFNECGAVGSTGLQLMVMCYGDTDLDGVVSFSDMATVLAQYGQHGAGASGDLNHDGVVDFTDLSLVLSNYGRDCTVPANGR